jgi:hypothetical protein
MFREQKLLHSLPGGSKLAFEAGGEMIRKSQNKQNKNKLS